MTYPQPLQNPPPKRHGVRNGCLLGFGIVAVAVIVIGVLASALGGGQTNGSTPQVTSSAPVYASPVQAPPSQRAPIGTVSQRNALGSAQDYLSTQAFSKAALIDQLSSKSGEGFPKADAVWAVDHLNVSWFREAVKSAREYLSMQSFSRSGLIDQLSSPYGAQFTVAQATYAANKVGL